MQQEIREFSAASEDQFVTRHIGGTSVAAVFARAFRLDQNPFDVWNRRARARDCVELALEWLSAFRHVKAIRPEALYDHSPSASWARSCRRLASDAFSGFRHLHAVSSTYALRFGSNDGLLVMGDATLGNFYVDGKQVGVVDFEDVAKNSGRLSLRVKRSLTISDARTNTYSRESKGVRVRAR